MSRRDKIIALAISKKVKPSTTTPTSKRDCVPAIESPAIQRGPIVTDVNELWSRPLDYKDFETIFDFQNEYRNSSQIAKDIDIATFNLEAQEKTAPCTRLSLKCYEKLPSSDEDECDNAVEVHMFDDSDDSVKDKDYCPDLTIDSDNDSSICNEIITTSKIVTAIIHQKTTSKNHHGCRKVIEAADVIETIQLRDETIGLSITNQHNVETDAETSGVIEKSLTEFHQTTTSTDHHGCREVIEVSDVIETIQLRDETINLSIINQHVETEAAISGVIENSLTECSNDVRPETVHDEEAAVNAKGFTKSGLPRKRRMFDTPISERLKQKKENADDKLALKPPCTNTCRKNCTEKLTPEDRQNIHDRYVNLNWESRGLFIKGMVEPHDVKTRTKGTRQNKKRDVAYRYHFFVKNVKINVCKTFFLTTLGYDSKNNRRIHLALTKEIDDQKDKRGSYERKNVIDKNVIKEHIQDFNPTISHYRREHAPNKLYLPSDINITIMHQSFMEKYPNTKISFETYHKVVKEMNISFASLGHEECEQCALFESHTECTQEQCELCIKKKEHESRYTDSREEYQRDKEHASTDKDNIYFSVDLQKVIMLPRMDQFKSAIFCPRIITFNESFVPLGKTSDTNVPYAVLWNETVSGRSQEDIISTFRSFLVHKRDVKNVVLWVDNCAAQNKNWAFLCFLVDIINSQLIAADSITIKYFEPGHTFMSADHFHHQVEMSLKKKKKVYDFDDFIDSVKMSNSKKNTVKVMAASDFYGYEDLSSQHKIRNMVPRVYLKNIMAVRVERGAFTIKHKEKHDNCDWKELDFLQVKIKKNKSFPIVANKSSVRGITKERKERIIADLLPLMPVNRRDFWLNLPESSRVPNLD